MLFTPPSSVTAPGSVAPVELIAGDWRRPDPALRRLRRLECLLLLGLPGLLACLVVTVAAGPAEGVAALLVVGLAVALAVGASDRRVAAWGYAEREDDLLVRRGVLVRRTTVVPYGRMQYVDVVAGPLDRRYGISTVVLHTAAAATDAAIPGLQTAEAERLRDRLAALGEARAAGV